ncbi:MAG: PepSY domain-containing protein [Myxococcales bacterium]|nr:PepSY domain-containing protein [Myxococcales bacterium]
MTRSLMLCACLFTANLASGCDQADDSGPEYRDQLDDAAITLEDAIDPVTEQIEAVVVDATFELGVDDGFYLVEAVEGEDLVVYEVDARTGERVVGERVRARPERLELARRHHAARRRLAQLVREIRAEHADERAVRARLLRDELEVELMDRRGRRHALRRRLAAADGDR